MKDLSLGSRIRRWWGSEFEGTVTSVRDSAVGFGTPVVLYELENGDDVYRCGNRGSQRYFGIGDRVLVRTGRDIANSRVQDAEEQGERTVLKERTIYWPGIISYQILGEETKGAGSL